MDIFVDIISSIALTFLAVYNISMEKVIKWRKEFLTGCPVIDLQHQYFAELINRIVWEIVESKDARYNHMLLEELIRYAQFHFISEENMLYKINAKKVDKQRKMHLSLIDSLTLKLNNPESKKSLLN